MYNTMMIVLGSISLCANFLLYIKLIRAQEKLEYVKRGNARVKEELSGIVQSVYAKNAVLKRKLRSHRATRKFEGQQTKA